MNYQKKKNPKYPQQPVAINWEAGFFCLLVCFSFYPNAPQASPFLILSPHSEHHHLPKHKNEKQID